MSSMNNQNPVGSHHIFMTLQERIERGEYLPGVRLPTERALALEFGVDRSVVQRSLAHLLRAGLIVREPGHRPRVQSQERPHERRMPESVKQGTIATILPYNPNYPAAVAILQGAQAALRSKEAPFRILAFDSFDTLQERQALQAVETERIAGVLIWHTGSAETLPLLRRLQEKNVPLVFVDRYPPELHCDFVGVDNETAAEEIWLPIFCKIPSALSRSDWIYRKSGTLSAEEAVNYLLGLGHQRIAHLTSTEHTTAVLQRQEGYREAMRTAGIPPRTEWMAIVPHSNTPYMRPAVEQFLGLAEPPTAVFAMNDALAHYFITELQAAGCRVPEDISVIGFDDLERYSPRPAMLTTLHQPFDKIGQRATELLLRRLSAAEGQTGLCLHILLPTSLIVRSTTRSVEK